MGRIRTEEFDIEGLNFDIEGTELEPNVFTQAQNFVVRENKAQRVSGYEQIFGTPNAAPKHLQSVIAGGQSYWLYTSDSRIDVTDGTTHSNITPTIAPSASDNWTSDLINNFPVLNNPSDDPVYWDGNTANICLPLPNWLANTKTKAIRTFGTYLFALGIDDAAGTRNNEVAWSDEAPSGDVPGTWIPAATNDAGDRELSETDGELVDAARLRKSFIIYKDFSTYICEFIGGNDVFSINLLYEDVGCLSENCVVEARNRHYVMSRDDIIVHDGVSPPKSIADRAVRNFYTSNLDGSIANLAFAVNNVADNEIWFCFPEKGASLANLALIYNIFEKKWGIRDNIFNHIYRGIVAPPTISFLWNTITGGWDDATESWNENTAGTGELNLLGADETGTKLHSIDLNESADGADISGLVARTGLSFGITGRLKYVSKVYPRITGLAGQEIQIRVGKQDSPAGAVSWGSTRTFVVGTDEFVDADTLGRYISIEFTSMGKSIWKVESFDMEYQVRGRNS